MNNLICLRLFVYVNDFICSPGAEGFTTEEDQETISRIEKQIKRRFAIGSQVSEHAIVQDFVRQVRLCGNCVVGDFLLISHWEKQDFVLTILTVCVQYFTP